MSHQCWGRAGKEKQKVKPEMEREKVDRKCDLDPSPSKKILNTLQDCEGMGLALSAGFGLHHSGTGAQWTVGVVTKTIQFELYIRGVTLPNTRASVL